MAPSRALYTDILPDHPELLEVKQKWDRSGLDITHLLSHSAREPSLSMAFNYASNLLNNSFFLENLVSQSDHQ
jgi:Fe-Mn family superoxide dismutase